MINCSLSGRRIVNTRAAHQAGELNRLLCSRCAEALPYPCIAIAPPLETVPLDNALRSAVSGGFDWLVLTSANSALALSERLHELSHGPAELSGVAVAAVGPATAEAAQTLLGVQVSVLPEKYIAESLAQALRPVPGMRVFLPQADLARPVLAEELAAAGADVTAVVAYRTVPGTGGVNLPLLLSTHSIDAITFASASAAQNFAQRFDSAGGSRSDLEGVCIACIGRIAAQAAESVGLKVSTVPSEYTLEELVKALEAYFPAE